MLLAAAGGLVALLVASWALELLLRMASRDASRVPLAAGIDPRVLAFTSGSDACSPYCYLDWPRRCAPPASISAPTLQVNTRGGVAERSRSA